MTIDEQKAAWLFGWHSPDPRLDPCLIPDTTSPHGRKLYRIR